MLYTNLKHIENAADYRRAIDENKRLVIVCGRMGAASVPVYRIAEELETEYLQVKFFDMEYDNPESQFLCAYFSDVPEAQVPLIVFFQYGEMVHRTWGPKNRQEMVQLIEKLFFNQVDKYEEQKISIETVNR